ncbi:unnamed protein product [Prunus armeniaca]
MISKRFEEVLKVNDFHKVFRLVNVEIIDIGLPKNMEGVKEDTVKRVVVILTGLYPSRGNYKLSSKHRRSSGTSGAQEGATNPVRIPSEYGQIFS